MYITVLVLQGQLADFLSAKIESLHLHCTSRQPWCVLLISDICSFVCVCVCGLVQDFGEYQESYYSVQTTEGEQISQLIAGYIDIILKKASHWLCNTWELKGQFTQNVVNRIVCYLGYLNYSKLSVTKISHNFGVTNSLRCSYFTETE